MARAVSDKVTVKLNLKYVTQTVAARCYEDKRGNRQWIPKSVCPEVFKHGDKAGDVHEVMIEEWWIKQNPFEKQAAAQKELF